MNLSPATSPWAEPVVSVATLLLLALVAVATPVPAFSVPDSSVVVPEV